MVAGRRGSGVGGDNIGLCMYPYAEMTIHCF